MVELDGDVFVNNIAPPDNFFVIVGGVVDTDADVVVDDEARIPESFFVVVDVDVAEIVVCAAVDEPPEALRLLYAINSKTKNLFKKNCFNINRVRFSKPPIRLRRVPTFNIVRNF